jgi:hypothetical protein
MKNDLTTGTWQDESSCFALLMLGNIYGLKLNMCTGKKHTYLGVDMEFNNDRMLDVLVIKYLQNVIEDFPEVITGKAATPAATPAADNLNVRDK